MTQAMLWRLMTCHIIIIINLLFIINTVVYLAFLVLAMG